MGWGEIASAVIGVSWQGPLDSMARLPEFGEKGLLGNLRLLAVMVTSLGQTWVSPVGLNTQAARL
jgi:hypothetical protein